MNGDGFDDVLVAAPRYDSGETDEGLVWLHLGSPPGLISSPNWAAQGDQAGAWFGYSVGGAGDLNGDSYMDVIIGAPRYSEGQYGEGRAYAYIGSRDIGDSYCVSTVNSTGFAAEISATGSPSASAGSLQLTAGPVPVGVGVFIHAPNQVQGSFGNGYLCVGGTIVRGAVTSFATNAAQYTYDNSTARHSLVNYARLDAKLPALVPGPGRRRRELQPVQWDRHHDPSVTRPQVGSSLDLSKRGPKRRIGGGEVIAPGDLAGAPLRGGTGRLPSAGAMHLDGAYCGSVTRERGRHPTGGGLPEKHPASVAGRDLRGECSRNPTATKTRTDASLPGCTRAPTHRTPRSGQCVSTAPRASRANPRPCRSLATA